MSFLLFLPYSIAQKSNFFYAFAQKPCVPKHTGQIWLIGITCGRQSRRHGLRQSFRRGCPRWDGWAGRRSWGERERWGERAGRKSCCRRSGRRRNCLCLSRWAGRACWAGTQAGKVRWDGLLSGEANWDELGRVRAGRNWAEEPDRRVWGRDRRVWGRDRRVWGRDRRVRGRDRRVWGRVWEAGADDAPSGYTRSCRADARGRSG